MPYIEAIFPQVPHPQPLKLTGTEAGNHSGHVGNPGPLVIPFFFEDSGRGFKGEYPPFPCLAEKATMLRVMSWLIFSLRYAHRSGIVPALRTLFFLTLLIGKEARCSRNRSRSCGANSPNNTEEKNGCQYCFTTRDISLAYLRWIECSRRSFSRI